MWAEGPVRPAGADVVLCHPGDCVFEGGVSYVFELVGVGLIYCWGACGTVEECGEGFSGDGCPGAEGSIRPTGGDAYVVCPDDFFVEGVVWGDVFEGGLCGELDVG